VNGISPELHSDCAAIVICISLRPGLSADDRQIAVLNTAFEAI
jgi:hypothetical protein